MAVLAQTLRAFPSDLRMCGARLVQELDLGGVRGVLVQQRLDKELGLQRNRTDGLRAAVLERLGHGRLVHRCV